MKNKLEKLNRTKFVVLMTFLAFLLKVLAYFIANIIFGIWQNPTLEKLIQDTNVQPNIMTLIISGIIIAPIIETVVGQLIPIKITSLFTKKTSINLIISVIVFSGLHDYSNILTGIGVGTILAYSYLLKLKISEKEAFFTTTAIHLLHNLIAVILLIIFM